MVRGLLFCVCGVGGGLEGGGGLVDGVFDLELYVAVGGEDCLAMGGEFGSASAGASGGGFYEGLSPGAVHGVDEEPGAAVGVVEAAGGF